MTWNRVASERMRCLAETGLEVNFGLPMELVILQDNVKEPFNDVKRQKVTYNKTQAIGVFL